MEEIIGVSRSTGRGKHVDTSCPTLAVSAIQSEAVPTKSHSYIWEIPTETEISPCWYPNKDSIRMSVVLNNKAEWRWNREGVRKLTLFLVFLIHQKNHPDFISAFSCPRTAGYFQCQKWRKPPAYRPAGAGGTLQQHSLQEMKATLPSP